MKKQKPAKKRGNPAKQRQKCAAGSARAKHVDPLTSLARTTGPNPAPKAKGGRGGASAEPARLGLPAARTLPQSYAWEDREAFAIVCAPFLILALWFTYQQTMRPIPAPLPEIAVHRDSGSPPPVVAMLPQPRSQPPPPSANPIEPPAPAVTEPAPAPLAGAAPVVTVTKPSSFPPVSETMPAASTIAPTHEAPATLPPLARIAPPAPPEPAPRVAVKRAPATAAPLPLLASISTERPAPAAPAEVPAGPVPSVEAAAPAAAAISPAPERQQHAALAPIARPVTAPPAPAIAPAPPAIAPPVEAPLPPAASPQAPATPAPSHAAPAPSPVPAPVSPQAAPTPAQAAPASTQPFEVCRAPAALFASTQSALPIAPPPAPDFGRALARAARDQLSSLVIYNAKYARIGFPNGDVAPLFGVCTDVVVRAYRMLGIDLQQLIAETKAGRGDRNIDHRRVEVVRRFLALHGETVAITDFAEDYQPGDIVTYYRPQNRTSTQHIAIVSDIVAPSGRYMIVHNRGWGPQLEDALFVDKITGHFRFSGLKKQPEPAPLAAGVIASTAPWALIASTIAKRDTAVTQPPPPAAIIPIAASSVASNGQSKPVVASLGPERTSLCRPGDVITGSTRTAEARTPASPAPAAAKPAPAAAKPTNPPAAKPVAPPATRPAQAKAQPKPLQKAATGTAPKPAPL